MRVPLFELSPRSLGPNLLLCDATETKIALTSMSKELPVDDLASLVIIQVYRFSFTMLFHQLALNFRQAPTRLASVYCPSNETDRPTQRML